MQRLAIVTVSSLLSLALAIWLHPLLSRRAARVEIAPARSDIFRVYVLGGSSAAGAPYIGRCNVGLLVAYLFGGEIAGRAIDVKCVAGSGANTALELEHARAIARVSHPPDSAVAVLYSGDNEFLEYCGHPALGREERRLFDARVVSREKREGIMTDYLELVEEIVRTLERAGVTPIVCTGTINVGDREPNRSVLDDPKNEGRIRELLERAETRFAERDLEGALALLRSALAIEPHFAWTRKRAGDALRGLGRFGEAHAEYQAAVDWDEAPLTFTPRQNAALRDLARRLSVPLVDAEMRVRAAARDGLPGYDFFWDICHPTLAGHLQIAVGVAEVLEARFGVERRRGEPPIAELESAFAIDREFTANMLIGRGAYMYGLAVLIWNPKERIARAHRYLDQAGELVPDDPSLLSTQAVLSLIEGDLETSRKWWKATAAVKPEMARRRLEHPDVVALLKRRGVDDPESMLGP